MKKPAKKPIKKVVVVKKTVVKKRKPVSARRKVVTRKKFKFFKPLGYIAAIGGALGFALLVTFAVSNLLTPSVSNDQPVLGATTDLIAPTDFKATVSNYRVTLTWDNMVDGEYQYLIWAFDKTNNKYIPEISVDGTASLGDAVSKTVDQAPGTTTLYRVSTCSGCQFTSSTTVSGDVGELSSGVAVTMPKLKTPTITSTKSVDGGLKISWSAISGVDGFNIWRATSRFGSYKQIGSVGIMGTYSAYQLKANGVNSVEIDIPSPTSFLDSSVVPGNKYYYKVSSEKRIKPLTSEKRWLDFESQKSGIKTASVK